MKTGKNIDSVIVDDYSTSVSIQSGAGKNLISLVGGKCSVSISGGENELYFNSSENVVFTGDKNDSITVYGGGNDVIRFYSLDSMENIINTALTPLLKFFTDLGLETINYIIDTSSNVATSIVEVEKLSRVEPFYRGKNS